MHGFELLVFNPSFYPFRFAHLINIDFFQDLMSVLHSLAEAGVSTTGVHTHQDFLLRVCQHVYLILGLLQSHQCTG